MKNNNNRFEGWAGYMYIIAVGLVVSGLCLRFGGEKFLIDMYAKKYNASPTPHLLHAVKYGGVGLYVGGWLILATCLSLRHTGNKLLKHSVFSAVLISAIWAVFEFKEDTFVTHPKLPLISVSVLLSSLVALISLKYKIQDILLIMVASLLIIFTEYFVLPYQRKNNISDGIGLPLLMLGWLILYYVFDGKSIPEDTLRSIHIPLMDLGTTKR